VTAAAGYWLTTTGLGDSTVYAVREGRMVRLPDLDAGWVRGSVTAEVLGPNPAPPLGRQLALMRAIAIDISRCEADLEAGPVSIGGARRRLIAGRQELSRLISLFLEGGGA
jgi:hypothetical protein